MKQGWQFGDIFCFYERETETSGKWSMRNIRTRTNG